MLPHMPLNSEIARKLGSHANTCVPLARSGRGDGLCDCLLRYIRSLALRHEACMEWGAAHVTQLQVLQMLQFLLLQPAPARCRTRFTRDALWVQGDSEGSAYVLTLLVELALPRSGPNPPPPSPFPLFLSQAQTRCCCCWCCW